MRAKRLIRNLIPPTIANVIRGALPPNPASLRYTGDFKTWEEAQGLSTGYASSEILNRTRAALLRVKNNEAAFERDSVTFPTIEFSFPLLSGLLRAAAENDGELSVLDFGGSLGSTYFQCRGFLSGLRKLRWNIVEQPAHVACGQAEFADDQLRFYRTIEECLEAGRPNVLLLSSVIQYLPEPYEFLQQAIHHEFDYVIVDRTAFLRDGRDRLTLEHVPEWIYPAVYPAWFLTEERFMSQFGDRYDLIASFPAIDTTQPDGGVADYKGFIFRLRRAS